ncbi:MAG TPA: DUF2283 domain-containing protein [Caldilineaceae bacterium]|nr:DUF2283 domain-containing protein [Caldilineaceae bacterium]
MTETEVSKMQIDYDPQADAVYVQLRAGDVDDTLTVGQYIFVDVDSEGVPLGLEILFAGRTLATEELTSVTVNLARAAQPVLA